MKVLIGVLLMASVAWGGEPAKIPVSLWNKGQTSPTGAQISFLAEACPAVTVNANVYKYKLEWFEDGSDTVYYLSDTFTHDQLANGRSRTLADAAKKICKMIQVAEKKDVGHWKTPVR